MTAAEALARSLGAKRNGSGWLCRCPAHDDHDPSLSIEERSGKALFICRSGCSQAAVLDALRQRGLWPGLDEERRGGAKRRIVATYSYRDAGGALCYQVVRFEPKDFRQRRPDGAPDRWLWNMTGIEPLPYRLPELLADPVATVFVAEGEKDCDNLAEIGVLATCNHGGAGKWKPEISHWFAGRNVVVIPDNDDAGRAHARDVAARLAKIAANIRILELPDLPPKGDVSDWIAAGGTAEGLDRLAADAAHARDEAPIDDGPDAEGVSLDDFHAYMPTHSYIFGPTRALWPAASVNARIPRVKLTHENGKPVLGEDGKQVVLSASGWLDRFKPVELMTWAPGMPMIVRDRLMLEGGWVERAGVSSFNLYHPPTIIPGDAAKADKWLDHVHYIYSDDAEHILNWLAHRVQRPAEKINHALVLGGNQGIGKDSLLEPVKHAVGPWNFRETGPTQILGRFNDFLKAAVLRISEARDLGEFDRFKFYDHMKAYTAAPPDVLRVDEKHLREYAVLNCCGIIFTTNHETDGIYLTGDDRRHYVAWSPRVKEDPRFCDGYWSDLWRWYQDDGIRHVTAWLYARNLSSFDAKAPPAKTAAFWKIVHNHRPTEEAELADILDMLSRPPAVTLAQIIDAASTYNRDGIADWLKDRKNRRVIPHRLEGAGYTPVRNPDAEDGLFKMLGRRQAVYAPHTLSPPQQLGAARALVYGAR
jgi:hypothetical protein